MREFLALIPVLLILSACSTGRPSKAVGDAAKLQAARTQIGTFEMALDEYSIDNGAYPESGHLDALVKQPARTPTWKGPYFMESVPLDPWGKPYVYVYPGKHNANGFDLSSNGPDGRPGTHDDITNWNRRK
jgi:general secretion pathway protein G